MILLRWLLCRYSIQQILKIWNFFECSILLSFYPSFFLCFYPSMLLSFYPTILLSFYPSILLSVYPSILLSFYASILLCFYASILLSFYPSILLSSYPSILLSFNPSILLSLYLYIIYPFCLGFWFLKASLRIYINKINKTWKFSVFLHRRKYYTFSFWKLFILKNGEIYQNYHF